MSDYLPDSASLGRRYCPGCEPAADVCAQVLEVSYCATHAPSWVGRDDPVILHGLEWYSSGNAEVEPDTNRAFCNLIHRKGREA